MLFTLLKFSISFLLLAFFMILRALTVFSIPLALFNIDGLRRYEVHFSFLFGHLSQLLDYDHETVGIKSSVVLLAEPKRSVFPVRHLFSFTHVHIKHLFTDFG